MKYSGYKKLLCEYQIITNKCFHPPWILELNTDAYFLVYNHRPERTGFNMYAENTQQQFTFLALLTWKEYMYNV